MEWQVRHLLLNVACNDFVASPADNIGAVAAAMSDTTPKRATTQTTGSPSAFPR